MREEVGARDGQCRSECEGVACCELRVAERREDGVFLLVLEYEGKREERRWLGRDGRK